MTDKLAGLHPDLVAKIRMVYDAMACLGCKMIITDGVRSAETQAALYAIGRTKPGRIVTNADGYEKKSNHQPHADGFGHACDSTFLNADGKPFWPEDSDPIWHPRWQAFGACAGAVGLKWGGLWSGLRDLPHTELP